MRSWILPSLNILALFAVAVTQMRPPPAPVDEAGTTIILERTMQGPSRVVLDEEALRSVIVETIQEHLKPTPEPVMEAVSHREPAEERAWDEAGLVIADVLDHGALDSTHRADLRALTMSMHPDDLAEVLATLADAVNRGELPPPDPPGMFF